jgi:hypothetical protein
MLAHYFTRYTLEKEWRKEHNKLQPLFCCDWCSKLTRNLHWHLMIWLMFLYSLLLLDKLWFNIVVIVVAAAAIVLLFHLVLYSWHVCFDGCAKSSYYFPSIRLVSPTTSAPSPYLRRIDLYFLNCIVASISRIIYRPRPTAFRIIRSFSSSISVISLFILFLSSWEWLSGGAIRPW